MTSRRLLLLLLATGFPLAGSLRAQDADSDLAPNFHFTVLDAESGKPISGADVSLASDETFSNTTTNAQGVAAFRIKKRDPQLLSVMVQADGHVPTQVRWRRETDDHRIPEGFSLRVERGRAIGGRVVTEAGEPIANAKVSPRLVERLSPAGESPEINTVIFNVSTTTDADGKWSYDRVPKSLLDLELTVDAEGFLAAKLHVHHNPALAAALQSASEVTRLSTGVTISGEVVESDGGPIVGADVRLDAKSVGGMPAGKVATGPGGRFSFQTVGPGEVLLTATAPGRAPKLLRLQALGEGEAEGLTIALDPGQVVEGRVVDDAGQPIPQAELVAERWEGNSTLNQTLTTNGEGAFRWDSAPATPVQWHVSAPGCEALRFYEIEPGEPVTITLEQRAIFSGQVTDAATGKPVENFTVSLGIPGEGDAPPTWMENKQVPGRNGFYQISMTGLNQPHVLGLEAPGYKALVSPTLPKTRGLHELNLKMQPME